MANHDDHGGMHAYKVKTIRALERGLDVLRVLQTSRAASLHELHIATSLPKATLTRIIATLEQHGLVWQRLADGGFLPTHTLLPRPALINDECRLVEAASPVLERLCLKVNWPSVLAVPRLDYMEVIETNRPKSYFSHIPVGPIGYKAPMLRSAIGRAYLAFCSEEEREAVLQRLRVGGETAGLLASRRTLLDRILEETRSAGYGHRYAPCAGHYNYAQHEYDDGRDSIAVPVVVHSDVIATVNLTWLRNVTTAHDIVAAHLGSLKDAAAEIARRLDG